MAELISPKKSELILVADPGAGYAYTTSGRPSGTRSASSFGFRMPPELHRGRW